MKKRRKILMILLPIIFLIFMEGLRLHYTIEAVRVSKEIKAQKTYNQNLQKDISREKIKLTEKMDLNTIKKRAEKELGMEVSESINYVKMGKSVSK
ncbi:MULTISPECIES: hypothetical protein [Psychrilyobacter]|uniref:Cell division protein FtsL n=1 Tax=Psychrilyobacter piezotolerans TaxID=2293438 RepID=A0ABX9KK38_9FUSO|nr:MULTISPECIES: hypothetical protein [Psychrilyobacter]MCS5421419.1 hypothetical protein [Psychrilyobacter sp. S5]NDI76599.1 hypothetical protein [Psychrilyobacter piezotolerans]RDE65230.1 hypothetical protein DV867_01475 [Psychrilyobacter sp. S5]REI42848.1 hypothetical protein DYH56_01475 [Psychrilyobacter piezotolerans]